LKEGTTIDRVVNSSVWRLDSVDVLCRHPRRRK